MGIIFYVNILRLQNHLIIFKTFVMPNQKSDDRSKQQGNTGNNPGRQDQQSGQGGQTGSGRSDTGNQRQQSGSSRGTAANRVRRAVCLIVIARDSKAIRPTVIASRANRKKLLQSRMLHLMTMTRTQSNQNKKRQTGIRIQTVA